MKGTEKQRHLIATLMTLVHAGLYKRVLILIRDTSHYNGLTDIIREQTPIEKLSCWAHMKENGTLRLNTGAVIRICTESFINTDRLRGQQWDMVVPFDPTIVVARDVQLGVRIGDNPLILRPER